MKHTLGKIILFFMILSVLYSEDFSYHIKIDNKTPYLKEATLLTFDVNQTNHDIVLMFNFDLQKSSDYYFLRVGEKEEEKYHNISIRYTYLIYPLKEGNIDIKFNLIKKITTDDKVAYSFSGDRDNVKGLVTKDTIIPITPLRLHTQALPKDIQLVGDFTLNYTIEKYKANPYEPIGIKINIKGQGYPPLLNEIFSKKKAFNIFKDTPHNITTVTQKGIYNNFNYSMALSATKDFTMPSITLRTFNPQLKKSYRLTIPSQDFKINKHNSQILIDKSDSPAPLNVDWTTIKEFFNYIIIFLAGYFTKFARDLKASNKTNNRVQKKHPLREKIKKAKDLKTLLQLLLSSQKKELHSTIVQLESAIYHQKELNLHQIKKEILERLQ